MVPHGRDVDEAGIAGYSGGRHECTGGCMEAVVTVQKGTLESQRPADVNLDVLTRKKPYVSLEEGFRAAREIRAAVKARGEPEMTMEEIDAEIAQCRLERQVHGFS